MQVGRSIGPYRVVGEVGRGMGAVFLAERPEGDGVSTVVLKVFRVQGRSGHGSGLILWHRELEALCALKHPNVVRLVDFGEDEDFLYLATEFAEGMTLAEYRRAMRPGLAELLELVRQVASGLAHAHAQGVLHLDLKPDNIVVAGQPPVARIVDFGLSRFSAELRSSRPLVGGTFRYMAPELLREGRHSAGPRADLYSLGVVLFESLTGCAPYDSFDPADLIRCKLTGAVRLLGQLLPGVPPEVERVASRLLAVDPVARYADAQAVAAELQDCLATLSRDSAEEATLDRQVRWPRKSPLEARFVGRLSEQRALRSTFEACQRGKGQIVLIAGEQGIGKSRLASEFGQVVVSAGGLFLCGRGTLMTRSTPYYPLLAAASEYLAASVAVGLQPAAGSGAEVRERLARLIDHLLGAGGGGALELEVDRSRERFFNLLMTSLGGLAPPGTPLVLLLDDFHWADPACIEFVERLAQRVERLPILVVCLYRKELVERLSRLGRMASELKGAASLMELPALSVDEVAELVLDSAGFSPMAETGLADYIDKEGRGNPLDTMSVAFRLMEREVVSVVDGGVTVDVRRLSAVVSGATGGDEPSKPADRVLDMLDAQTRSVVGWASIIGDRFLPETLARIMGAPVDETGRRLAVACATGVLRSTSDGQFGFTHDAFRERVYSLLEPEERKERHQRVAETLEAAGEGQEPMRIPTLAEHFSRGRDIDKALHYSTAAGESSCRIHAHDSARRYLKAALLMLRARASDTEAHRAVELRVRQALGDTYAATGEYEFADREYSRALELATTDVVRADLIGRKALVCFKRGELETAVSGMERALELLGLKKLPRGRLPLLLTAASNAVGLLASEALHLRSRSEMPEAADPVDRLRIALLNKLTFIYFFFSVERTITAHLISQRQAQRMPFCPETIEALSLHGPVLCSVPMPGRALRSAGASVNAARALGQPGPLMVALFYSGVTNYFLARWEDAARSLREAMALFGKTGDVFTLVLAHENLGFTLYQRGEFGQAMAQFNRGLELSADVGDQRGETVGHAFLARVHAIQGDLNRARRHLAAAGTKVHALNDNSLRCGVRHSAALVHLATGQRKQAISCLEECYTLVKENRLVQEYVASVGYTLAETLLGSAEQFEALPLVERTQVVARSRDLLAEADKLVRCFPAHAGPSLRVKGLLALCQGQRKRARKLLRRSVEQLKLLGMRYEVVRTFQLLAEASPPEGLERVGALAMAHRLALEVGCAGERVGGRREGWGRIGKVPPEDGDADGGTQRADDQVGFGGALVGAQVGENELLLELVEVGRSLAASLDLDTLARRSLEAAVRVTRAEKGLYCLVDRTSGEVSVHLTSMEGQGDEVLEADHYSRSVIENALRGGAPLLIDDALMDPRFGAAESVLSHQLRSVLCFPVVAGGRPLAAIYLENNSGANCFRPFHMDVVRMLAAQVSVAMENGLAFARVEEMNRELEARVQARTRELTEAGTRIEEKNEELTRTLADLRQTQEAMVRQEKLASVGRLAAGATHEINNPLNFVQGGAYAVDRKVAQVGLLLGNSELKTEKMEKLLEETRNLCGILINGSNRIKNVVEGLWNVAHGREPALESHDLRLSIASTVALVQSQPRPGLHFETELADVPPIVCIPGHMDQLFLNLVLNAIDAMDGRGTIRMKCWAEDGFVAASVADTGRGIPAEVRNSIFEPFFSSKPPGKGAGLGLAICMSIVSRRGGTIAVQSELGKGATFVVRLPIRAPEKGEAEQFRWPDQG